ncbi:molybdate ABC transporter substrate-binding protein [Nitrincola iocasae]|uniref:Molybdate ABC transporter substrate-binding protein n=1 Tax=Nitrincola iocasae TaxID=2614693 RepID=A0A5J6L9W5_9GAMM|nr:molybdate ABC transporter substrate-binding protein [Nitrincola iocasae]QEW05062.1 molybdate ABC transporter substrate-binding protein [Nitrincola iocasae]
MKASAIKTVNKLLLLTLSLLFSTTSLASELRVAVAANFLGTLNQLAPLYEAHSGQTLLISSGSTGRHYAQIRNGAPFDVFLSADVERPQLLVDEGLALADSRFTYARGVLVLWSDQQDLPLQGGEFLHSESLQHLALVNPRTAPYGAAGVEVMQQLGAYERLQAGHIAQAENLTQAMQYITSGTAQAGFLALSQVIETDGSIRGNTWLPDVDSYASLEQQAVVLSASPQLEAGQAFLYWLKSDQARAVIEAAGYGF